MNPPRPLRAWVPLLPLLVVGLAVPAVLPELLGMVGPGGSDPGLWVLAAENLRVGASPTTAPLYPGLAAGLAAITGASTAGAAHAVSVVAFALLPPVTWLLARRLGADTITAMVAGVLGLLLPSCMVFAVQIQADALTALVLLGMALACLAFMRRPGWGQLAGLMVSAASLALVREQIVPLAALMVLLALLPKGGPGRRILRAVAVAVAVWAAPLLLGLDPGLPWQQTWFVDRVGEAARDATGAAIPKHIRELPSHMREPYVAAYERGDQLALMLLHMRRSLVMNWHAWIFMGLGGAGVAMLRDKRGVAIALVMLGLGPPLVAWSQPRHIAVFAPVAAAAWAASFARRPLWGKLLLAAAAVAVAVLGQGEWATVARKQAAQARTRVEIAQFGAELCTWLEPGAVVMAGNARSAAYCPLPRVQGGMGTPYDWKLVWLGDMPQQHPAWTSLEAGGWAQLELTAGFIPVYRLRPWLEGAERPCAGSVPVGPFSHSRFGVMAELPLSPPCEEPSPIRMQGRGG